MRSPVRFCRDLPDLKALEDAGLLSKEKLLAGDIMPTFAEEKNPDESSDDDGPGVGEFQERHLRPEL